jgi:hypothetical protein
MEVEAPLPAHNLLAQKGAASSLIELTELAALSAKVGLGNAQAEHDIKGMRARARQLTSLVKKIADEVWKKAEEGILDVTIPENKVLYEKRGALQAELENTTLSIRLMQEATATAVEQQGNEYRRLESVQKMVSMHFNAIDNSSKLIAGSSEVKMISKSLHQLLQGPGRISTSKRCGGKTAGIVYEGRYT